MAARALATAYVNIVPGTQQVEQYLRTGFGGQVGDAGARAGQQFGGQFRSKFGMAVRGIAGPLVASLGAAGVAQFFSEAVKGASDLNEQAAAVGQVFGSGQSAIQKFADGAAQSLGQSKVQILEASKSFGIFGKAAGLTGDANAQFSTSLVTLATDLASFNNTSVDDALMALQAGLRGENEPMRRFGVLLDDAALKAEAMAMGIYKGKGPLDQQAKILAANSVIFKQTATQQGDFARTSGGLANQQRILTASWADAQATLGQALIPTMTQLVTYLNQSIIPAVKQFFADFSAGKTPLNDFLNGLGAIFNFIKENWSWIATLGTAILGAYGAVKLMTGALALWNTITKVWAVGQALFLMLTGAQTVATTTARLAQIGLNIAMLANPIGIVVALIAGLVAGLVWFFTQTKIGQAAWDVFGKFMANLWNGLVKGFQWAFGFIAGIIKGYINGWLTALEMFINFFIHAINTLLKGVNAGLGFVGSLVGMDIKVGLLPLVNLPRLAKGGFVDSPTIAQIGEAGPEVVTPLRDFERMMGIDGTGKDRPIYADGMGLIGWMRETAQGEATIVFNKEMGKTSRGIR